MKKIIYLNTDVKIGEMIMYEGLEIEVTQKLISDNPSIFETVNEDTPLYFKCLQCDIIFTKDRIYKQTDHSKYPAHINLIGDDKREYRIVRWTSSFISDNIINSFELTTKAEWDKQELLDKAKREYPIGTVHKDVF